MSPSGPLVGHFAGFDAFGQAAHQRIDDEKRDELDGQREDAPEEDIEDDEAEEEAVRQSTDYPADQLKSFKNEQTDDIFDQDADDVTQILALADQLLYRLMDFNRIEGDEWINADDTMERTQLKLKEVMRNQR